jgi:hypothetical protein
MDLMRAFEEQKRTAGNQNDVTPRKTVGEQSNDWLSKMDQPSD